MLMQNFGGPKESVMVNLKMAYSRVILLLQGFICARRSSTVERLGWNFYSILLWQQETIVEPWGIWNAWFKLYHLLTYEGVLVSASKYNAISDYVGFFRAVSFITGYNLKKTKTAITGIVLHILFTALTFGKHRQVSPPCNPAKRYYPTQGESLSADQGACSWSRRAPSGNAEWTAEATAEEHFQGWENRKSWLTPTPY